MFNDRIDAANRLVGQLRDLALDNPLILAIPRGGVPMGAVLARELNGELDVVLVRKLPAPGNPEFALAAVSEGGKLHAASPYLKQLDEDYVRRAIEEQSELIQRRREQYTPAKAPADPTGRDVVIVDDGSATGATMEAALTVTREHHPARLVAALGAAPPDTVTRLRQHADEVVCLITTANFSAVGQFFARFNQVSDEEVIALLSEN